MDRELRKHPRIPINKNCSLRFTGSGLRVDATTFNVATHGMGLNVNESNRDAVGIGDEVTISIPIVGERIELGGTISWVQGTENRAVHMGICFDADPVVAPAPYLQWVEDCFASLREQSMARGGEMAFQRQISLRTYQEALDHQARDGGDLEEHLQQLIAK